MSKKGPRTTAEPELMGAKEVAATLGIHQSNVRSVVGLPEPYDDEVAATTLWRADEIREFARERDSRPRDSLGRRIRASNLTTTTS